MAKKLVHYLKRKLQKDEQYFSHYKDFMDEIIEKGYVSASNRKPNDGKLQYLTYHGDYHLVKPNKVCVVFGCSGEYAGKSIRFWLDLAQRMRSLAHSSDLGKERQPLLQTQKRYSFKFWLVKNIGVC